MLDLNSVSDDLSLPVRLSLVAHYEDENGTEHAVFFRPESLADAKTGRIAPEIPWSRISRLGRKPAFLLLPKNSKNFEPWVYSGADEFLYKLLWNRTTETTEADINAALSSAENLRFYVTFHNRGGEKFYAEFHCADYPVLPPTSSEFPNGFLGRRNFCG